MNKPELIVITGPTASGKTALSVKIAETLQSKTGKIVEIISADSRQIYKHIPITTTQPSNEILSKFKHYFINELELDEEFNAGLFGNKARKIITHNFKNNKITIAAGGSGLYINSLIYGFFDLNSEEENLNDKIKYFRKELHNVKTTKGMEHLINELIKIDKEYYNSLNEITERRVIRALEIYYATGIPFSVHRRRKIPINFIPVVYAISMDRDELYNRINIRTEKMLKKGMIEEIETLFSLGFHYKTHNSLNTVGAKEIFDYLEGKINKQKMTELIKQNTRRFAKRQLTWFRADKNINWIESINGVNLNIY